jgi:replicative DNA helicase
MKKGDSIIVDYITKRSVYNEVLKFIFHSRNVQYKYLYKSLSYIYGRYVSYNLTPHQNTIINIIACMLNMLLDDRIAENTNRNNLLLNIAVSNVGTNTAILSQIEEGYKDVNFEDIDRIASNVNDIVKFVELVDLVSDNYAVLDEITSKDVIASETVAESLKKVLTLISNTLTKYSKSSKTESMMTVSNIKDEVLRLKEDLNNKYFLRTDIELFNEYGLLHSDRLTLFASPTNHGKTTVLSGILANAAYNILRDEKLYKHLSAVKKSRDLVLCFISLEESDYDIRKRILSNILRVPKNQIDMLDELEIENRSRSLIKHEHYNNIKIYVKYLPAGATVADVELLIQQLQQKEMAPVLVAVDYMDKLSSTLISSDIYRLQLTSVSYELRNIALKYNLSMITATQLNRESITRAKLDIDLISESYGKSWEADSVVVFRQRIEDDQPYLEISIPKSRHTNRLVNPVLLPIDYSLNVVGNTNVVQFNSYLTQDKDINSRQRLYAPVNKTVYDIDI